MTRGFQETEHTADVALDLWAEDEVALLEEAARAVVALLTEGAPLPADARVERREVSFASLDPPDRLVRWMNEVLFWALTEGLLVVDAELSLDEAGRGQVFGAQLVARVRGVIAPEAVRVELKSATYHELELSVSEAGARAHVVLDV
jgi:SHS2 domain-containing protein